EALLAFAALADPVVDAVEHSGVVRPEPPGKRDLARRDRDQKWPPVAVHGPAEEAQVGLDGLAIEHEFVRLVADAVNYIGLAVERTHVELRTRFEPAEANERIGAPVGRRRRR